MFKNNTYFITNVVLLSCGRAGRHGVRVSSALWSRQRQVSARVDARCERSCSSRSKDDQDAAGGRRDDRHRHQRNDLHQSQQRNVVVVSKRRRRISTEMYVLTISDVGLKHGLHEVWRMELLLKSYTSWSLTKVCIPKRGLVSSQNNAYVYFNYITAKHLGEH